MNETYETENPVIRRPAALNPKAPRFSYPAELFITTRRPGDVVLLMVEQG